MVAPQILEIFGLQSEDYTADDARSFKDAADKLIAGQLDAAFFMSGMPTEAVQRVLASGAGTLLNLDDETRERLTGGIFISGDADDGLGRIELAFQKQVAVADIERKARQGLKNLGIKVANDLEVMEQALAEKIISQEEGQKMRDAYEATLNALAVDDFLLRE